MEQVLQLQNKLTFQQWRIAESLGWADADNINCIGHLVNCLTQTGENPFMQLRISMN